VLHQMINIKLQASLYNYGAFLFVLKNPNVRREQGSGNRVTLFPEQGTLFAEQGTLFTEQGVGTGSPCSDLRL